MSLATLVSGMLMAAAGGALVVATIVTMRRKRQLDVLARALYSEIDKAQQAKAGWDDAVRKVRSGEDPCKVVHKIDTCTGTRGIDYVEKLFRKEGILPPTPREKIRTYDEVCKERDDMAAKLRKAIARPWGTTPPIMNNPCDVACVRRPEVRQDIAEKK